MLVMILSLEKDKERFKTATTALDSFNIPWVKVNAVYGKEVKRDEHYEVFCGDECVARHNFLSKAYYRGHLSDGELGCAMSHLKAYHKLALSDEDGAIIMEDDFSKECADEIEKAT